MPANATSWKPGKSGNPGGMPKQVKHLLERARQSVPAALDFADELLKDVTADPRVRLEAAKFLCSYGLGAPPKVLPEDDDKRVSATDELTVEELRALARQSLADDASESEDASDDADETEH